jgi:DNA polymerase-3 subunit epsilon
MKKHALAFVDIETTGLDITRHEIIQIGCVLVEQDWSTKNPVFTIVDTFECKIQPVHIEYADKTALKINGYSKDEWEGALPLKEALAQLAQKTKDAIMIGHNVAFDYKFLDMAFKITGVKNLMHYHLLDTISIAYTKLHERDIQKYSLYTLTEQFGIKNEKQHTALADAQATFELYKKLMTL